MIAETVMIVDWPQNTITPVPSNQTICPDYGFSNFFSLTCAASKEFAYWKPPETLSELGRMILKRRQRANYQLIYKRRNRNLHIQ